MGWMRASSWLVGLVNSMKNNLNLLIFGLIALLTAGLLLGFYLFQQNGQTSTAWVTTRLNPDQLAVKSGQEFNLDLWIDSSKVSANVFSLELIFPVQKLEFVGFDKSDSLASIWFEEEIEPAGLLRVTAGVPNPGFQSQGKLATLKLKALKVGQAEVGFTSKSSVFRNQDNKNILGLTQNAQIEITE